MSAAQEDAGPAFLAMLGIALLGGLILNLMPRVLPVLSLKLISVVSDVVAMTLKAPPGA